MKDLITVFEVEVKDRDKNVVENMTRGVYRNNRLEVNGRRIDNTTINHNTEVGRCAISTVNVGNTKKVYFISTKSKTQHFWNWSKPMGERKEPIEDFIKV